MTEAEYIFFDILFSGKITFYSKTCVKRPFKNRENKDLNDGQKYRKNAPMGAFCNTFDLH